MRAEELALRRLVLPALLGCLAAAAFASPAFAERPESWEVPPNCATPTIAGTPGDDTLLGTPGEDVIAGYGGDDTIDGMGGDDVICAGTGADMITDESCGNQVAAGYGNDTITVRNRCYPRSGEDVWDGPGDDRVRTGYGNDRIFGGSGHDNVRTGYSADSIYDGPGDDLYYGEGRPDSLYVYRPGGFDRYYGGPNRDWVVLEDYPHGVSADLRSDSWTIPGKRMQFGPIHNVTGTDHDDRLIGDGLRNKLYPEGGDDFVSGRKGNDFLFGDLGRDLLYGGSGRDLVYDHDGSGMPPPAARWPDLVYGGRGDDWLYGGLGRDRVYGGPGNDVAYGNRGGDRVDGGPGRDQLYGNLGFDRCLDGEVVHQSCERKT